MGEYTVDVSFIKEKLDLSYQVRHRAIINAGLFDPQFEPVSTQDSNSTTSHGAPHFL